MVLPTSGGAHAELLRQKLRLQEVQAPADAEEGSCEHDGGVSAADHELLAGRFVGEGTSADASGEEGSIGHCARGHSRMNGGFHPRDSLAGFD